MCGIVGFIDPSGQTPDTANVIEIMAERLTHRGPDDCGRWTEDETGVCLGHRRLAVLDLSPQGHQPMVSACGRYVIVYNGEIYNFEVLRKSLIRHGHTFRGHSDTEVLLEAVSQWGIAKAVTRLVGMFAFALWDRQERTLTLARDRIGEKPLFYGKINGVFVFASELKAMAAFPGWKGEVDRDALTLFMRHAYIPAPKSIYKNVFKMPPATLLTVSTKTSIPPQTTLYWSLDDVAANGKRHALSLSDAEAVNALDSVLREAVRDQMVADVPLGMFLSGGVDSSTVAALMQAESMRPIKTFSIGFENAMYNEANDAKAVAQHLGTDHTELYVTPREAREVIPQLPDVYDEPFADPSQIPTLLLSQMTRTYVTVALSGDGGDELFGGYNRYSWGNSVWHRVSRIPRPARRFVANLAMSLSAETWNRAGSSAMKWLPSKYQLRRPGDRLHKLAGVLDAPTQDEMYCRLISSWREPVVIGETLPRTLSSESPFSEADFVDRIMLADMKGYLPGDILTKVDRAAMAVSLETRIPFLDHRVVAFSWRLPMEQKIRDGVGKWLLRQVLNRYVPNDLIERPKTGFGVPLDEWLRGPLRDWAESLLLPGKLKDEGYLDSRPILELWHQHQSGRRNWQYPLWNALMFQTWLERWKLRA